MTEKLAVREVEDGQLVAAAFEICGKQIKHPLTPSSIFTVSPLCACQKDHQGEMHISHPYKNIVTSEIECLQWYGDDPDVEANFVFSGFEFYECGGCGSFNRYSGVDEPCWSCGSMNPSPELQLGPLSG